MHETTDLSGDRAIVQPAGVYPRRTESLLREQEGVLDASVWFDHGDLAAHVTLHHEARWTARGLQSICMEQLGLHQTPRKLFLIGTSPSAQPRRAAAA